MSLKSKRICKCCGKEYEYCPHCGSHSDEMWRNLTDTKECLAVFNIVAAYNVGRATPEQVKKVLKENNISNYSSFQKGIVDTLNNVFEKAPEKKLVEIAVEESPVEKIAPMAPHINNVEPQKEAPVVHENVSRKNRNGKKKYRRNTDIGL